MHNERACQTAGPSLLFCFSVHPPDAQQDRTQAQHFAGDGTQRTGEQVIHQPAGRADQAEAANGLGIGIAEADGGGSHANDRQEFHQQMTGVR